MASCQQAIDNLSTSWELKFTINAVRVEQYYAFALYLGVNYLKILVDFVSKSQKAKKSLNIQITENPFQISKNPEKIDIKRVSAFEHSFAVYC